MNSGTKRWDIMDRGESGMGSSAQILEAILLVNHR